MRRLMLALIVVLAACGVAPPTPRPTQVSTPTPTPRSDIAAVITDTIDLWCVLDDAGRLELLPD